MLSEVAGISTARDLQLLHHSGADGFIEAHLGGGSFGFGRGGFFGGTFDGETVDGDQSQTVRFKTNRGEGVEGRAFGDTIRRDHTFGDWEFHNYWFLLASHAIIGGTESNIAA